MKRLSLVLVVLLSIFSATAQQRSCGTMQHLDEIKQRDADVEFQMDLENLDIKHWINNNPSSSKSIITIPVVVHVLYKTSSQNISDNQIYSQMTTLNDDFRKQNADVSSTPSAFMGVTADTEIEFCLAVRDPNNNVSTGITRTQTSISTFNNYTDMKYTSQGGIDAWNTDKYLNVWVCNLGNGLLGFAQFPNTGNSNEDGVVCNYTAFGNIGTASYPYDEGRTLTHEVGHWLNLRHIWGDSYCGNDYVSDTPKHEESNYGCPSYPHSSACSGTGTSGEMFMNYMDYTYDACMFMFTTGQKTRMRATLNGSRSSLLTSLGCQEVFTPLTLSATTSAVNCNSANIGVSNDGSVNLTVTGGTAPFTYIWSTGASTQDISSLISGNYTVTVTDAVGQVETANYIVNTPSAITVNYSVTSSSAPGVSDGSVAVNVSGGSAPYSYYWSGPNSYSATTQDLQNVLAGTYTYYVIDDNGCYELLTVIIPEGQLSPLVVSAVASDVVCNGDNNGTIDLTVSGGATPYSFIWSNTEVTEDLSNLSSGTYTVTVTDAAGQSYTNTYVIAEPNALTATYNVTNVSTSGGNDGAIDLTASGGVAPYLYYWSTSPTQTTEDISNLIAGTYTVWIVDVNNCYIGVDIDVVEAVSGCTDYVTGLNTPAVLEDRVIMAWDNMNTSTCTVTKYNVRFREVGTSAWSQKGAGWLGCSTPGGLQKVDRLQLNMDPSTTYEWKMKVWYCDGNSSYWGATEQFTTQGSCPDLANLQVQTFPGNHERALFTWDSTATYEYARVKLRVDTVGAAWQTAGGFGVYLPLTEANKFGLVPGESYRGQAQAYCHPVMSAWASNWTPLIFWTQPDAGAKVEGGTAITNLDVYPNPSRDVFNISFTSEDVQDLKVRVLNVVGEVIISEELEQFVGEYTKQINLEDNAKGIYFLEIETNDGVINKKLILQ